MTDPVLLRDLLLTGEGLAASVLLPGLAWLAASCFPRRAALRHLIWLAAFIGLLILPPMAVLLPAHVVIEQPAVPPMAATDATVPERLIAPAIVPSASFAVATQNAPASAPRHLGPAQLAMGAFALWLAGLVTVLLYHAMALLGLSRLRRRYTALPMPIPELQGPWQLRIATQPDAHGPLTWGLWRPVILLPHHALSWPRERLVAVLRHEIAHVRRCDMLTQVLAQLVCAFYWPNPLVWLSARRLRMEAEIAADNAVLSAGVKPSSYAETLMVLAAEFRGSSPALAMAAPSTLEARVTSVLTSTQSRSGVTVMDVFKTACLGTAAIALMALARPDLAIAEATAPPTASVAAAPVTPTPTTAAHKGSVSQGSLASAAIAKQRNPAKSVNSHIVADTKPGAAANSQSVLETMGPDGPVQIDLSGIYTESVQIHAMKSRTAMLKDKTDKLVAQAEADPTNPTKAKAARAMADAMIKSKAAESTAEAQAKEQAKDAAMKVGYFQPQLVNTFQNGPIRIQLYINGLVVQDPMDPQVRDRLIAAERELLDKYNLIPYTRSPRVICPQSKDQECRRTE